MSSLDLKLKDEDIRKWDDHKKIETLSNLINATKKKNLSNIDLTMVVKLPNSISFEKRILKLMKEPEKVTYRFINRDTKKIDLIMFQNFQKLFLENDMTWINKNNEFIYAVRTLTEKDRIEQIMRKNFNQNSYLGKVEKANTFWLILKGKLYRSVNWVYQYYKIFLSSWTARILTIKMPFILSKSGEKVLNKKNIEIKNLFTQHLNNLKH